MLAAMLDACMRIATQTMTAQVAMTAQMALSFADASLNPLPLIVPSIASIPIGQRAVEVLR
jgi:type 1 glutamine amidotransferase